MTPARKIPSLSWSASTATRQANICGRFPQAKLKMVKTVSPLPNANCARKPATAQKNGQSSRATFPAPAFSANGCRFFSPKASRSAIHPRTKTSGSKSQWPRSLKFSVKLKKEKSSTEKRSSPYCCSHICAKNASAELRHRICPRPLFAASNLGFPQKKGKPKHTNMRLYFQAGWSHPTVLCFKEGRSKARVYLQR